MGNRDIKKPDPEMLKNLDLLMNWNEIENEKDWDLVDEIEVHESDAVEGDE